MSKEGKQQSVVQSENPKTTGVLQRVRSGEEGDRSKEEGSSFAESRFQADLATVPVRQAPNKTGLPDRLKAGVEALSGYSLDDVRVHYNSSKPAQLQSLAYTQGTEIHVAPGQERHLAHEAWHVVQQMQGRVKPTMQIKGVQINDDVGLEKEADVLGQKALHKHIMKTFFINPKVNAIEKPQASIQKIAQLLRFDAGVGEGWHIHHEHIKLGKLGESRVEFRGRTKKEIRKELGEKIARHNLDVNQPGFRDCINYINDHFG